MDVQESMKDLEVKSATNAAGVWVVEQTDASRYSHLIFELCAPKDLEGRFTSVRVDIERILTRHGATAVSERPLNFDHVFELSGVDDGGAAWVIMLHVISSL